MMTRKEMMTARETLTSCHQSSHINMTGAAATVADLVQRIGYDAAREIVALCVISKGEWDARISEKSRVWAFELTGTTYGTLSAMYFYYPDAVHPAHMEQIARAMMEYQPEPEEPAEAAQEAAGTEYTEKRTMDAGTLRSICIQNDWYTRGTCAQYNGLFDRLHDQRGDLVNLTTAKLAEIAQDIAEHSELPEDYDLPCIMFELARRCTVTFDQK